MMPKPGAGLLLLACSVGQAWGGSAPQLELARLDGAAFVRLSELPKRPLVLNFWRSDCPPCVAEMPLLNQQARRYTEVVFIGIATEEAARARRFLATHPVDYLQLLAPSASEGLMRRFGNKTGALPYTVVLNSQHQICQTQTGPVNAAWLAQTLAACGP